MYRFVIACPPLVADDEVDVLPGGPILLSKVIAVGPSTPYGGAPVTGLTNLLHEVIASPDSSACNLSTPSVLHGWSIAIGKLLIHTISYMDITLLRNAQ